LGSHSIYLQSSPIESEVRKTTYRGCRFGAGPKFVHVYTARISAHIFVTCCSIRERPLLFHCSKIDPSLFPLPTRTALLASSFSQMLPCKRSLAISLSYLFYWTSSHMFIASPRPIEGSAPKDPLNADGSNFPCHGVALPVRGGQQLTAGSSFELKLDIGAGGENNAVHGGGSCQLAVTYETTAEKIRDPNNWHVVYSIQGGCPANAAGNLDKAVYCEAAGQSECINTWDVPLPKGLRSGHAILSWTWFNVIGKREMYQNCANINIIGGTGEDMEMCAHRPQSGPMLHSQSRENSTLPCQGAMAKTGRIPRPIVVLEAPIICLIERKILVLQSLLYPWKALHLRYLHSNPMVRQTVEPCTDSLQLPSSLLRQTLDLGVLLLPREAVIQRCMAKKSLQLKHMRVMTLQTMSGTRFHSYIHPRDVLLSPRQVSIPSTLVLQAKLPVQEKLLWCVLAIMNLGCVTRDVRYHSRWL
jgi:hypothetical protein